MIVALTGGLAGSAVHLLSNGQAIGGKRAPIIEPAGLLGKPCTDYQTGRLVGETVHRLSNGQAGGGNRAPNTLRAGRLGKTCTYLTTATPYRDILDRPHQVQADQGSLVRIVSGQG